MRAKVKGKGDVVIVVGGGERRESGRKKKMAIFFGLKIRATVSDRQIAIMARDSARRTQKIGEKHDFAHQIRASCAPRTRPWYTAYILRHVSRLS